MTDLVLITRLLLAAVMAVAGVAKLVDPAGSRRSAKDFGVPGFLTWAVVWGLPVLELAIAVALVRSEWAWWGSAGALGLLLLFMAGIGLSLARGRRPDCHCFGQLHSGPVGGSTIARNGVLACMAGLVLWKSGAPGVSWFSTLTGFEEAVLALAIGMAALAAFGLWLAMHFLQQNGRLLLRLEAVEKKLGIDPAAVEQEPEPGLPLGSVAPGFTLEALDGGSVTLEKLEMSGRPVLLVFSEPGCSACESLMPELAQSQRGHAERLAIVPVSQGDVATNRTKSAEHGLENVLLQRDREVSDAYGATGSPAAVLIRDGKIASPVAMGADPIRQLIARASLPPAVKQGDPVPELRLPDLTGAITDLGKLKGRPRLVLFWNPGCGFCQQMLDDLKAWEHSREPEGPELLVISSGSLEENRSQGFQARVLLDQNFGAGQVFDVEGTPAAVLIDPGGRVASSVAVGGPAVLALAGAEVAVGSAR